MMDSPLSFFLFPLNIYVRIENTYYEVKKWCSMNRLQQESESKQLILQWQNELNHRGFIENEGEVLNIIQGMEMIEEKYRLLASELLTIVAQSMSVKGRPSTLVHAWMEKAKRLNPQNKQAIEYLARYEWEKNSTLLDVFTFPSIRETDNKQAKKQAIETYI